MDQPVANEPVREKPFKLKASIPGHVEKMEGKKAYTCYQVRVTCQHHMGPEEHFFVERRYSDFHNFHLALKVKVTYAYTLMNRLCVMNLRSNHCRPTLPYQFHGH